MTRTSWSSSWSFTRWITFIGLLGVAIYLASLPLAMEQQWTCTLALEKGLSDSVIIPVKHTLIQDGHSVSTGQVVGYRLSSEQQGLLESIRESAASASPEQVQMVSILQSADQLSSGPTLDWIQKHVSLKKRGRSGQKRNVTPGAFLDRRRALQVVEDSLAIMRKLMLDSGISGGSLSQRTNIADLERRQMFIHQEISILIKASDHNNMPSEESSEVQWTAPLSDLAGIAQQELSAGEVVSNTSGILAWIYSNDRYIVGFQILKSGDSYALLTVPKGHQEAMFEGQRFTFYSMGQVETVDTNSWEGIVIGLATPGNTAMWYVQMDDLQNDRQGPVTLRGRFVPTDLKKPQTLADVLFSRRL